MGAALKKVGKEARGQKSVKTFAAESFAKSASLDFNELICPITKAFMIDPVMAEDGYTYDKRAIERWFSLKGAVSPMTNEKMSSTALILNRGARSMIRRFANQGVVGDSDSLCTFYKDLFLATIKDAGVGLSDLEGLLKKADEHASSANLKLSGCLWKLFEARRLVKQADDILKECSEVDVCEMGWLSLPSKFGTLSKFYNFEKGTLLLVINDAAKLKQMCMQRAPGAEHYVGFCDEMFDVAGKRVRVIAAKPDSRSYRVETCSGPFSIPFCACVYCDVTPLSQVAYL